MNCWGIDPDQLRVGRSPARLGAVFDRILKELEAHEIDALPSGKLHTNYRGRCLEAGVIGPLVASLCALRSEGEDREAQSRRRVAVHADRVVSFLVEDTKRKESANQGARRSERPTAAILPPKTAIVSSSKPWAVTQ